MSFLDDILGFFGKIFDFIADNFWIILAVVIIVLAIFYPGILLLAWEWVVAVGMPTLGSWAASVATFFAELGLMGTISAVVGISFLLDPEGTAAAVGDIIESGGSAAGEILGQVLNSPIGLIGGALLLYSLLKSDDSSSNHSTNQNDVYHPRSQPYDPYYQGATIPLGNTYDQYNNQTSNNSVFKA